MSFLRWIAAPIVAAVCVPCTLASADPPDAHRVSQRTEIAAAPEDVATVPPGGQRITLYQAGKVAAVLSIPPGAPQVRFMRSTIASYTDDNGRSVAHLVGAVSLSFAKTRRQQSTIELTADEVVIVTAKQLPPAPSTP